MKRAIKAMSEGGHRRQGRNAAMFGAGTAMLALSLLSACSSAPASSQSGSTGSSAASSTSNCVEQATASVKAASAPLRLITPSAFDTSALKGKKFAYIGLTERSSVVTGIGEAMKEALAKVGATTLIFDGQGTPSVIASDFNSAIAQHVSGIATDGFGLSIVASSLAAAKSAGMPVVDATTGEPNAPATGGLFSNVATDDVQEGVLEADYALAHSDCKVHGVGFDSLTSLPTVDLIRGATAELHRLCPTNCTFQDIHVNGATYPSTMPGQVENALQRSASINYIFSTSDTYVPYAVQGVKAVGRAVPILGVGGNGLSQAMAGDGQVADVMIYPPDVYGYYVADAVMRAASGQKSVNFDLPLRLVDASDWGSNTSNSVQFPELAGFKNVFYKAWGVS
jgi:ribose transport system substrate-binding protein